MTEKELRRLRVDASGKIHACGVCGFPVELISTDPDPENWLLRCKCADARIILPVWCIHDAYSRKNWIKNCLSRFRFFRVTPP